MRQSTDKPQLQRRETEADAGRGGTRTTAENRPRRALRWRRSRANDTSSRQSGITLVGEQRTFTPTGTLSAGGGDLSAVAAEVVRIEGSISADGNADARHPVTTYAFEEGSEPQELPLHGIAAYLRDSQHFVWVNLCQYDEDDLRAVAEQLGLSRGVLHAIRSPWHRPWLQVYEDHFFVSTTVAHLDPSEQRVQAGQLDLVVGHNYVLSAHRLPLPFRNHILARAQHNPEFIQLDASFLLYVILDELIAYYEELERHIEADIECMEERALRDTSDAYLEDLLHFKRYAFALAQLADQHGEVFTAFLRPDFSWISGDEVELYFRDLEVRFHRLLETLDNARDAVNGAFEIYVSHVSHRTNQIIKLLTMVSTILLPASVVIGLFGISVQGVLPRYGPLWFLAMIATIALITGAILVIFRHQKWI